MAGVVVLMHAPATTLAAQKRVDFQRDVRPILSDNCFLCHGPDQSTRKANLRLDLQQDAMTARRNGAPVVPGKPDESLLYKKITEADPARRMPPISTPQDADRRAKDNASGPGSSRAPNGNNIGRSSRPSVQVCHR